MKRKMTMMLMMLGVIIGVVLASGENARAAQLTVTKTADTDDGVCDADCSLREAIAAAAPGDEIVFAAPLFDAPQVITLSDEAGFQQLTINKNLTITGKGAKLLTVRRSPTAAANFRIFEIQSGTVNLTGMTITGGHTSDRGGGINNRIAGNLTVSACHITGNTAGNIGGGIRNEGGGGALTVINSTISNNVSGNNGGGGDNGGAGGISSSGPGILIVTNSTISGNSAPGGASGGIYTSSPTTITHSTITRNVDGVAGGIFRFNNVFSTSVRNSVIASNCASPNPTCSSSDLPDVSGSLTSNGYNLIGNVGTETGFTQPTDQTGTGAAPLDPQLLPLADNGGTTPTHALQPPSPAVDKGHSSGLNTDQRGFTRPVDLPDPNAADGDGADIGAFELQTNTAPTAVDDSYSTNEDTTLNTPAPGVLSNDTNGEDDMLTAILVSNPANAASFTFNADGSFAYTPNANFNGMDSFTYKVSDGEFESNTATVTLTINAVNDPPAITAAAPLSRQQGAAGSVSTIATVADVEDAAGSLSVSVASAPTGITVTSITNTDGTITASVTAACNASIGANTVNLQVLDSGGAMATAALTVHVTASSPPVITLKPAISLWPPNHNYRTFTVSDMVQSAADGCDGNLLGSVVIERVTSDEAVNAPGNSDGNTVNDIVIAPNCKSVQLRSERDENRNGRVYVVTLRVRDSSGNETRANFRVSVPLSQNGNPAIEDAPAFTVNSSCP